MSTSLAETPKTEQPKGLRAMVTTEQVQRAIASSLAGVFDSEKFTSNMIVELNRAELAGCSTDSKYLAFHVCATMALAPWLQHVALIPRALKDKGESVTVMPQWQGLHAIMMRHPDVLDIRARLVHRTDTYSWDNERERLTHTMDPFAKERVFSKMDDVVGGYLVITYRDGRKKYHLVHQELMVKARGCAKGTGIWDKWVEEQCLKTVYRNAYARRVVPIDALVDEEMTRVLAAEDEALENDPQRVVRVAAEEPKAIPYQVSEPMTVEEAVQLFEEAADAATRAEAVGQIVWAATDRVLDGDLTPLTARLGGVDESACYLCERLLACQDRKGVPQIKTWIQNSHAKGEIGDKLRDRMLRFASRVQEGLR
jgi:recombinational DNA repair protein RecT